MQSAPKRLRFLYRASFDTKPVFPPRKGAWSAWIETKPLAGCAEVILSRPSRLTRRRGGGSIAIC